MPKRQKSRDPQIWIIGKSYYFRGSVDGTMHETKLGPVDMGLALAKLKRDELLLKLRSQGVAGSKLTCGAVFADYLKDRKTELKNGEIRQSTFNETEDIVNRILTPAFGEVAISSVEEHWDSFRRSFGTKDPMNSRKVLRHFMGWCRDKRHIRYVPEFKLKTRDRRERVNLTEDEVLKLFPCFNENIRLLASLCLLAGMRPNEARTLEWNRVDFAKNRIILRKIDTKTNSAREVPMNAMIRQMLELRKSGSESAWVFPRRGQKNRPMDRSAYLYDMMIARQKANLDRHVTMHDLRATFEHWAHMNPNFTDTQLEKMLGAKVDVQRRIYVKMGADHLQPLAEAVQIEGLDGALGSNLMGNNREKSAKSKRKKVSND